MRSLRAAASLLSAALSLAAFAPAPAARQQQAGPPPAVDLPMQMRGPMPAVEVMVNGKGPFLFAIDTGGQGRARVDTSLVERLGLKPVGEVMGTDGSGRPGRAMTRVRLDSIEVGGVRFEGVEAAARDYNTAPHLPKIDGILAFGFFADYLLTLDYPARRVRLARGELPAPDGRQILAFDAPRGIPVVDFVVGAEKLRAHIDSGNSVGAFVLPASLVGRLALASEPVVVGRARTVSSEIEIKQARLKDAVRVGGFEYKEPTVTYPAVSDEANLGSLFLRDFAVTFDQKNRRMRLERRDAQAPAGATPRAGTQR